MKLFSFLAIFWLCANVSFAQTKVTKEFVLVADAIYTSEANAIPLKDKLSATDLKIGKSKLDLYYTGEYQTKEGYKMKWTLLFNKKNKDVKALVLDKNNLSLQQFPKYYGEVKLDDAFWNSILQCTSKGDATMLATCIQERVAKFFK